MLAHFLLPLKQSYINLQYHIIRYSKNFNKFTSKYIGKVFEYFIIKNLQEMPSKLQQRFFMFLELIRHKSHEK